MPRLQCSAYTQLSLVETAPEAFRKAQIEIKGPSRKAPMKCKWLLLKGKISHFLQAQSITFSDVWVLHPSHNSLGSRRQALENILCGTIILADRLSSWLAQVTDLYLFLRLNTEIPNFTPTPPQHCTTICWWNFGDQIITTNSMSSICYTSKDHFYVLCLCSLIGLGLPSSR